MRRKARVDKAQAMITRALRLAGCSVQDLSGVGGGCPDLLAARNGRMWLSEVKNPAGPKGGTSEHGQSLNRLQVLWHQRWRADVHVVTSPLDVVNVVNRAGGWRPIP